MASQPDGPTVTASRASHAGVDAGRRVGDGSSFCCAWASSCAAVRAAGDRQGDTAGRDAAVLKGDGCDWADLAAPVQLGIAVAVARRLSAQAAAVTLTARRPTGWGVSVAGRMWGRLFTVSFLEVRWIGASGRRRW